MIFCLFLIRSISEDENIVVIQVPTGDEAQSAEAEVITIGEDEAGSSVVLDNAGMSYILQLGC